MQYHRATVPPAGADVPNPNAFRPTQPKMPKSLYVLDGYYQIYRAFYAPFRDLTSPSGEPTRATYVFCQMLFNLIRDRRPDYLAVAVDVPDKSTFRRKLDANYKAHREPAPDALHTQADRILSIISALDIPVLQCPEFEADDLMATIAERAGALDIEVFLVSRDKDLEQLITDRVFLYDASKGEVLDGPTLLEKKGYLPLEAVEIQTLTGDPTDNIPGVPGIGPKTAVKLIREYKTAEAVAANADKLTPKLCERLKAAAENLALTRQLVTLRRDVPLEFSLADAAIDRLRFRDVRPIFDELDFHGLKDQLDALDRASGKETQPEPAAKAPVDRSRYHLVDTLPKLEALATKLERVKVFAFDTETTGLNPIAADLVGISVSWQAGEAYYVPVRAPLGRVLDQDAVVERLKPIFEDGEIGKVGQNIKYDVLIMRTAGIRVAGIAFDTMIASFLLDPLTHSHGLDSLAKRLFGHEMIPISDLIGKGKNQVTIDQVDLNLVSDYAAEDADFTWRLFEALQPRIAGSHVEALFRETEMPLVEVLAEMEHNGVVIDTRLLSRIGESLGDRMIALTKEVHAAAGHAFNIDSPKQLGEVLFDEQGLPVVRKTKTGRSTDADTLTTLSRKHDNPIPKLVLQYREFAKLKGTYADTLPKMVCHRTGRLHASFDQTGAVTGRLSSRDPNLQNIPVRTEEGRRIREAFVAGKPDTVLLAADYSQIELRMLAHFCQDEALLAAFREGLDIHRAVAAQVNDVSLDEVTTEQRSAAKAVNFGIIYGQSAFGLAKSLGIAMGDAQAFIDAYFARYPGIRGFIDDVIEQAKQTGYVETMLGRRRPVEELRSRNRQQVALGERIAVNTVVQGSAADLIKRAMIDIHRGYLAGEHVAKMLIQVHDELVFEAPLSGLDETVQLIQSSMEQAMPLSVPIVVDVATGRNWAETK